MGTPFPAIFVISWDQTEVDGFAAPALSMLSRGAAWSWRGQAVCLDTGSPVLVLEGAEGRAEMRQRAARMVRRLIGGANARRAPDQAQKPEPDPLPPASFTLTDGRQTYLAQLLPAPGGAGAPLLMFRGALPPQTDELWLQDLRLDPRAIPGARAHTADLGGGFAAGTQITTLSGGRAVESLRPGDMVMTRDFGPQPVIWSGGRVMSGARLYTAPHLRPLRLCAPAGALLVAPGQRILMPGAGSTIWHEMDALAAAADLADDGEVARDNSLRAVTYHQILLARPGLVLAAGIWAETLHPAAPNAFLTQSDRQGIAAALAENGLAAESFGPPAGAWLSPGQAAILRHGMQGGLRGGGRELLRGADTAGAKPEPATIG